MLAENRPPRIRAPRRGAKPTVTVVVASKGDRSSLERCLAALVPQCSRFGAEVIVARAGAGPEVASLGRAMPQIRFILAPSDSDIDQLRALGMVEADGDIVALTDDRVCVGADWGVVLEQMASEGRAAEPHPRTDDDTAPLRVSFDWRSYFERNGVL